MKQPNSTRKRFPFLRIILLLLLTLLIVAVVLPYFVGPRFVLEGKDLIFRLAIVDAQSGAPVPDAKANMSVGVAIFEGNFTATTDARGRCDLLAPFPATFTRTKGRLRIGIESIVVRVKGYETWEKKCVDILGKYHHVQTGPFTTNFYNLKVSLTPQKSAGNSKGTSEISP